jgi:hypothetical protein
MVPYVGPVLLLGNMQLLFASGTTDGTSSSGDYTRAIALRPKDVANRESH